MILKRINTDVFIRFSILENNEPADLSTVKNFTVYVTKNDSTAKFMQAYTVEENIVKIQWSETENNTLGFFTITAEYDRDCEDSETGIAHYAVDYPNAFQIVPFSIKETEDMNIILSGDANQPAKDGLDGYTLWKKQTNQPNATYEDYVAYLRQPATEFVNSVDFNYTDGILTITTI